MRHYGVLGARRRVRIGFCSIYEKRKDGPGPEAVALAEAGSGIDPIF